MSVHLHVVPMRVVSEKTDGEPRWCFYCRKHVGFVLRISEPDVERSYYGPSADIRCEHGHSDGDCFPGRYREWGDA